MNNRKVSQLRIVFTDDNNQQDNLKQRQFTKKFKIKRENSPRQELESPTSKTETFEKKKFSLCSAHQRTFTFFHQYFRFNLFAFVVNCDAFVCNIS